MNQVKYNGWTNYETWLVNLWMSNDSGSDSYYREIAQEAWDESETETYFTRYERASLTFSDRLKSELEETQPEVTGLWAGLINAAMSEIDWQEIAEHYISDVDQTTEESDEYETAISDPDTYLDHAQQHITTTSQPTHFFRANVWAKAFKTLAHSREAISTEEN